MPDTIGISEGATSPDDVLLVYSTKAVPLSGTVAASSNSSNITLGPAGLYEIIFHQSSGAVPALPAAISLQPSGGGSNLVFFAMTPGSHVTRRFVSKENAQVVQVSNGFAVQITYYIQQVF